MGLAISEEHQRLAASVQDVLAGRDAAGSARAVLDGAHAMPPVFWEDAVKLGWLGLHIPECYGGQGFGLPELAVVIEQLGRAAAPGAFVPTVLALACIDVAGRPADRAALLPSALRRGVQAGVGLHGNLERDPCGAVSGDAGPVPGGDQAELLLLAVGEDLVVLRPGPTVTFVPAQDIDPARGTVRVRCGNATPEAVLPGGRRTAETLSRILTAAEAAGGAEACLEAAVSYAGQRVQFGQRIGSFQAVKHMCADMLVAAEVATATAWGAARAVIGGQEGRFAAAVAAEAAAGAFVRCAELNIQVHGGVGFTWEHPAHLYLRRALALRAGAGDAAADVTDLALAGAQGRPDLELPPEAEAYRREVRAFLEELRRAPAGTQPARLVRSGYAFPHWPRPYGRAAGPVEQLVVEQEMAGVPRPRLGIGGWILPTLLREGTPAQVDRWLWPSLEGKYAWCQLFSEPDAGSDAAAIRSRGRRAEGGWTVTGHKTWVSAAQSCQRGLATVRTDPDAPVHQGITTMVIDMTAAGVTVRPLRDITGRETFNEVFLEEVFVPEQDVVGPVNGGWAVARATLANERVSIGAGSHEYVAVADALDVLRSRAGVTDGSREGDGAARRDVGCLLAERQALRLLDLRNAARALAGTTPGPEGNVTKLLSGEHQQRVADLLLRLGGAGAVLDGVPALHRRALFVRALTIAGGTSEIIRNQIAERALGLPRD